MNTPKNMPVNFCLMQHKRIYLLNGVYWDKTVPRLFEKEDVKADDFIIQTIADVTDDINGSVPINAGDQTHGRSYLWNR